MIKSSKLGGVLLGEELGFLDILKILAVLDTLFYLSSILGYYKDDEGRGLSLFISLYWHLCSYLFGISSRTLLTCNTCGYILT
jgi:hypothetical protein